MGKWQRSLAGVILAMCAWTPGVMAQSRSVDVGGRDIVIPLQKDYVLISDSAEFMDLMKSVLPSAMDLLAVSMHTEDLESDAFADEVHPYYLYATTQKLRSTDIDDATWLMIRPMIEEQLRQLDIEGASRGMMEKGSEKLSAKVGEDIEISANMSQKQEVWAAPDGSLRMTSVVPGSMRIGDKKKDVLQDAGMAMLPVRERMMVVYIYRTRAVTEKGDETIRAEVERAVTAWRQANPPVAAASTADSSVD